VSDGGVGAHMSQREGPPRGWLSEMCLRLASFVCCTEEPNEWQFLWQGRDALHHASPPPREGVYRGHTYVAVSLQK